MKISPSPTRLILLVAASCWLIAGALSALPPINPKVNLSSRAVQLKVKFVKQDEPQNCGVAALKMLEGYYDQKLDESQLQWLKDNSTPDKGILASEMVVVLGASDFETGLFPGTLDNSDTGLLYQLDRHRPLIVMITSSDGNSSHYDVVTGYDPTNELLLLLDPAVGPLTVTWKAFAAGWKRANNFTLLAVPKKLLPPTPTPNH